MTKVEIYTLSLKDKKSGEKVKFEKKISEQLFNAIFKKFPNYILEAPPKDTYGDIVKVYAKNEKSLWNGQSSYGRVNGIIVVGRDRDKELAFSNSDKLKTDAGKKIKGLSVDKKHYFDIIMPMNKSTAFLFLEKTDGKSYKKHIFSLLQKFIPSIQPGLNVSFEKFIEKDIVIKFLGEGNYSKLEFIRKEVPSDSMTRYLGDYTNEGNYTVKTAIISEDETDFPDILKRELVKAVENKQTYFSLPQLEKLGFEEGKTSLRVTSEYDGSSRTIDLSNTMRIQPIYEIDIELEDDGFVDYERMKGKITKLVQSLNLDIL